MPKGPSPKRDAERRRRNRGPKADKIELASGVVKPPAPPAGLHPLARRWYRSLGESAQSRFYEPSDWATAAVAAVMLSRLLETDQPKASLHAAWAASATELLTTEGARRRFRLEIERGRKPAAAAVLILEDYRDLTGGPGDPGA